MEGPKTMFLTEMRFGHPMYIHLQPIISLIHSLDTLVHPMYTLVHPMYIYVHPMYIHFATFTVHEVQAKPQKQKYCVTSQIIDNRLGHVIKYLLTFSLISIT